MGLTYPNSEHVEACFCIRFPIPSQHFERGTKDLSRVVKQCLIPLRLVATCVINTNPNDIKSNIISTSSNTTNLQCATLQPSSSFSWLFLLPWPSPRRRLYPYRTKYVKPAQTRWTIGDQCNALTTPTAWDVRPTADCRSERVLNGCGSYMCRTHTCLIGMEVETYTLSMKGLLLWYNSWRPRNYWPMNQDSRR